MGAHHTKGVHVISLFARNARVRVADGGCDFPLALQTGRIQVTVMTPWVPAVIKLALGALLRDDALFRSMKERLGTNVMASFTT